MCLHSGKPPSVVYGLHVYWQKHLSQLMFFAFMAFLLLSSFGVATGFYFLLVLFFCSIGELSVQFINNQI